MKQKVVISSICKLFLLFHLFLSKMLKPLDYFRDFMVPTFIQYPMIPAAGKLAFYISFHVCRHFQHTQTFQLFQLFPSKILTPLNIFARFCASALLLFIRCPVIPLLLLDCLFKFHVKEKCFLDAPH